MTKWLFFNLYRTVCNSAYPRSQDRGEEHIGYDQVGMIAGAIDRGRWVPLESLLFNVTTGITR